MKKEETFEFDLEVEPSKINEKVEESDKIIFHVSNRKLREPYPLGVFSIFNIATGVSDYVFISVNDIELLYRTCGKENAEAHVLDLKGHRTTIANMISSALIQEITDNPHLRIQQYKEVNKPQLVTHYEDEDIDYSDLRDDLDELLRIVVSSSTKNIFKLNMRIDYENYIKPGQQQGVYRETRKFHLETDGLISSFVSPGETEKKIVPLNFQLVASTMDESLHRDEFYNYLNFYIEGEHLRPLFFTEKIYFSIKHNIPSLSGALTREYSVGLVSRLCQMTFSRVETQEDDVCSPLIKNIAKTFLNEESLILRG